MRRNQLLDARQVTGRDVVLREQVRDQRGGVAIEERVGEVTHHRLTHLILWYRRLEQELASAGAMPHQATGLEPPEQRRDRGGSQAPFRLQRGGDVGDGGIPLPERPHDRELEIGELVQVCHVPVRLMTTHVILQL